jgi:hypothetical protein
VPPLPPRNFSESRIDSGLIEISQGNGAFPNTRELSGWPRRSRLTAGPKFHLCVVRPPKRPSLAYLRSLSLRVTVW